METQLKKNINCNEFETFMDRDKTQFGKKQIVFILLENFHTIIKKIASPSEIVIDLYDFVNFLVLEIF